MTGHLRCTGCGAETSYADAAIADSLRTCPGERDADLPRVVRNTAVGAVRDGTTHDWEEVYPDSDSQTSAETRFGRHNDVDLTEVGWCEVYGEDDFERFAEDVRCAASEGEIIHNVGPIVEDHEDRVETLFRYNGSEFVTLKVPIWLAEEKGFDDCFITAHRVEQETEKAVRLGLVETYGDRVFEKNANFRTVVDEVWVPKSQIEWAGYVLG